MLRAPRSARSISTARSPPGFTFYEEATGQSIADAIARVMQIASSDIHTVVVRTDVAERKRNRDV
jgi:hypothetical protein